MFREGIVAVVCGPSGVGKGTILNFVRQKNENIRFSVSATTRKPRTGEVEGSNYFFVSEDSFKKMIKNDELVEWVEYCGNYYGTPQKYVDDSIKNGYDVILEIEVQGAANIKKKFPHCISIFILPPSFDDLKSRIEGRGTETPETIAKRLDKARYELTLIENFDYVIINNEIDKSVNSLNSILLAERLRESRNKDILTHIGL